MSLEDEITKSAREIYTDGYEMSIGELASLYKDKEIIINPEFQRLFRWGVSQKTKFIESILLGIPIPPIFVFQTDDGVWELVDGLQRLSTIFEFMGILRRGENELYAPSVLEGTNMLPSLSGRSWDGNNGFSVIGRTQQLILRRARMRVEILKKESDPQTKYDLFQRLNTGGSALSEQEVRTCVMLMVDKTFFNWVRGCSEDAHFRATVQQTEEAELRQKFIELTLRFFVYRNIPYGGRLDVHEYLDDGMMQLTLNENFNRTEEERIFKETFNLLDRSLGNNSFKRFNRERFLGQFLLSVYEVVAIGVSKNLELIKNLTEDNQIQFINEKVRNLWNNETFQRNSGAGVRGTTRLANLLSLGEEIFRV